MDANERETPGWKYNHYEMKGVPVRVEVGPKDVEQNACVTARRDRWDQALALLIRFACINRMRLNHATARAAERL